MIELSDGPASLSVRLDQLVIAREEQPEVTVPLADIACLVVAHPRVLFTHAVLSGLAARGAAFVVCNERFLPIGMLLPLDAHTTQAEQFAMQAAAPLPVRNRLWRQIVQAKVRAQGRLLARLRGDDQGLFSLADEVTLGDRTNIEAQASRRYWAALFPDTGFRRLVEADDENRFLNYGYAILRAIVARALCAAGLHPSFGLHHHHRNDAYCLADDVMEPFRPIVDAAVVRICDEHGADAPMDKATKAVLFEALLGRFIIEEDSRTLFDLLSHTAATLAQALAGQRKDLVLPEL
jgi:CRISPR-associated protein Cas1